MKFIPSTYPHCGANLRLNQTEQKAVCEYCGTVLFLDGNTTRIEYVNAEQAGYNFEKGHLRAQAEQAQTPIVQQVIYLSLYSKSQRKGTHSGGSWVGYSFFLSRRQYSLSAARK